MFRTAVTAAFLAAFVGQANAAAITDWNQIAKVFDTIPSAAGISVHKRMDKCGVKIVKDKSWMETRAVDWPEYGARAGETVLLITIKIPSAAGQPPSLQQGTKAIWLISRGKPMSVNAWAQQFQSRTVPMGYDAWMNC
ncbi:MAG TPA: hypothetical protein VGC27_04470 [Rhizomicrobium sp.]